MSSLHNFFLLNVGFIIHETVGYSRDFPFEAPVVHLSPDLNLTDLEGVVRVTRTAQGLLLQVRMSAYTKAGCVRCLEDFAQRLDVDSTELYAFNRNSLTESGLLVPENGKINLEPLIRDEMLVATPISPLCRIDCRGLCTVCGENLNRGACSHNQVALDSRLEVLRSLLDDGSTP